LIIVGSVALTVTIIGLIGVIKKYISIIAILILLMILGIGYTIYDKNIFDVIIIYQLLVFLCFTALLFAYIVLIIRRKRTNDSQLNDPLDEAKAETEEILHDCIELSKSNRYFSIESTPEKKKDFEEKTKGFRYIDY